MKNKEKDEALKSFKKIYYKSKTKAVRIDNGSEFTNEPFKDYLEKMVSNKYLEKQENRRATGVRNDLGF
jgi:ABC-type proline/glycine betaine transport system ATPase subunit